MRDDMPVYTIRVHADHTADAKQMSRRRCISYRIKAYWMSIGREGGNHYERILQTLKLEGRGLELENVDSGLKSFDREELHLPSF